MKALPTLPALLDEHQIGLEGRAVHDDHLAVRTWLRLLACATQIEQAIRGRLRDRYGTSLARFDYLAQLQRHPGGLRMSALSRYLMVTGGNVTGLTQQLEADGLVKRVADPEDGRSWRVKLTPRGRSDFNTMAREHETWVQELLSGLPPREQQRLYELLGTLRQRAAQPEVAK